MSRPLLTSVGSFPILDQASVDKSIELFADLQCQLGFDVLTDGEPRTDMIRYFVEGIPGLSIQNRRPAIVSRISTPARIDDLTKIRDYAHMRRHLDARGIEKGIKVALTGPITLGFTCALGGTGPYRNMKDPELYAGLAHVLSLSAKRLQELGAIVQIDEPGLSAGFIDPAASVEHLNMLTAELRREATIIHVCGRISPKLSESLLKLNNIDTLSLAFATEIGNISALSQGKLSSSHKRIGIGCARVNVREILELNSVAEIVSVVKKVKSAFGDELVSYIHPDCGLRTTPLFIAKKILENLSLASSQLS